MTADPEQTERGVVAEQNSSRGVRAVPYRGELDRPWTSLRRLGELWNEPDIVDRRGTAEEFVDDVAADAVRDVLPDTRQAKLMKEILDLDERPAAKVAGASTWSVSMEGERHASASSPFGGVGLSGYGREGGTEALDAHTVATAVTSRSRP